MIVSEADGMRVERVDAPDAAWWALLSDVRWGTNGLRYRLRDVPHLYERWNDAVFLQLVDEAGLAAVFTLVPRTYRVDGFEFKAFYRTMLAVRDGTAGRGIGRRIATAAKEAFLDAATGPTLLYGFIEADNERSLRLQQRLGYQELAAFEATGVGWLFPTAHPIERASEADRPAVLALMTAARDGHVLDDIDQSLHLPEVWVLREQGRVVATVQASSKELDIENLPGLDGRLLLLTSPLLRHLSPFFRLAPHRLVWLGHAGFERPEAWLRLVSGLQHRLEAASLLWYSDGRSPSRQALSALGPVHALSPSPMLKILAGWKHIPDEVIAAIRSRPLALSPLDAS